MDPSSPVAFQNTPMPLRRYDRHVGVNDTINTHKRCSLCDYYTQDKTLKPTFSAGMPFTSKRRTDRYYEKRTKHVTWYVCLKHIRHSRRKEENFFFVVFSGNNCPFVCCQTHLCRKFVRCTLFCPVLIWSSFVFNFFDSLFPFLFLLCFRPEHPAVTSVWHFCCRC